MMVFEQTQIYLYLCAAISRVYPGTSHEIVINP